MQPATSRFCAHTPFRSVWVGAILLLGCLTGNDLHTLQTSKTVSIHGTVKDCSVWDTVIRIGHIRVYAYTVENAKPFIDIFEKREQLPDDSKAKTRAEREEIFYQYDHLYAQLLDLVDKRKGNPILTRTNDQGRYEIKGLPPGRKYLLLAIDPVAEGRISYFSHALTDTLEAGDHTVNIWMGVHPEESCRSARSK